MSKNVILRKIFVSWGMKMSMLCLKCIVKNIRNVLNFVNKRKLYIWQQQRKTY